MAKLGTCGWCCTWCFLCFILPFGIVLVIGFFVNVPSAPKCYIQQFYLPALDQSLEGTTNFNSSTNTNETVTNPSLFFDLALRNGMDSYYVIHSDIKLTFSYNRKNIADFVIPSFFQGKDDTDYRRQVLETRGVPWDDVLKAVSNGSKVVFRVDLVARPQLLYLDDDSSYKKSKDLRIGADVEVDGSGMKVQNGLIRLVNSAGSSSRGDVFVLIFILFALFSYNT